MNRLLLVEGALNDKNDIIVGHFMRNKQITKLRLFCGIIMEKLSCNVVTLSGYDVLHTVRH